MRKDAVIGPSGPERLSPGHDSDTPSGLRGGNLCFMYLTVGGGAAMLLNPTPDTSLAVLMKSFSFPSKRRKPRPQESII